MVENNSRKVYIIGAGPGDPELITLKGSRILKQADCVLYDFLSTPALLDDLKDSCEKICVGKADGLHLQEQHEINELLYQKAQEYQIVVRLKGGDPFIFSRGYEEMTYLQQKGVDVTVIPGVTSAIAGPEMFGIPLTIKNKISSVAIITGRKKDINAEIQAPHCGTLVYLMAVANIDNVVKGLLNNNWQDNTPCAFIEDATHKNSRIVVATIATIAQKSKQAKIKPPAVLIVGEVVNYENIKNAD